MEVEMVEKGIQVLSKIRKDLAQARTVSDFKGIRDKAEVCRHWAARQGASFVVVHEACAIKLEAERGAGKVLTALSNNGEIQKGRPLKEVTKRKRPSQKRSQVGTVFSLEDLGILSKNDSSRWQTEAWVPAKLFREYILECLKERREPTSMGLQQIAAQIKAATKIADILSGKLVAPEGLFDVVIVDPPWPMERIERDVSPEEAAALDYPTMTIEEIEALTIPCAEDCHVWLWAPHRFLPTALSLLDAWGLNYVCTFVWHKPGGFQPWGLPQYNCEFALYARRGAPVFVDVKDFNVCFEAPRGAHSEKPDAFYDMVRRVTGGRRIDMFNRRPIEGFEGSGNEA